MGRRSTSQRVAPSGLEQLPCFSLLANEPIPQMATHRLPRDPLTDEEHSDEQEGKQQQPEERFKENYCLLSRSGLQS